MSSMSFDAAEHILSMIQYVWQGQPTTVVRLFQTMARNDPELAKAIQRVLDAETT